MPFLSHIIFLCTISCTSFGTCRKPVKMLQWLNWVDLVVSEAQSDGISSWWWCVCLSCVR